MNYQKNTLELDKVFNLLKPYCQTNLAKKLVDEIDVLNDYNLIDKKLNEVEELRKIIVSYDQIPFGGIKDISNIIKKASLFSILNQTEVLEIRDFIYGCKSIIDFKRELINKKFTLDNILSYFDNIYFLKDLLKKIDEVLDEKGIIFDNASPELYNIRKSLKKEESSLRNKLNEILATKSNMLSDTLIVTRNNHLCVGVKVEFKNVFKGIIMDYSQSGQTVYMEPMACAEIQARLNNLKFEENQEEIKILQKLTGQIGMFDNELNESLNNITYLDLISAKALFAVKYNCFKPNINENQNVKLINARHPLIDQSKVVPISIELGSNYKGIIITGPNTGGKTVALKTVGLLTLMTQSGLLIPADPESDINIFDKVFADIGDEQSIEQSLSTFSSHMTRIINIIDNVSLNSLVLFDELGSGTDPKEGSSLAIAIIKFLLERNSRIIITSHYLELKEFAYNNGDLLNASVEFDIKTLKPTYRLLLGTPGKSNALEIAKRLGLDKRVINYALEEIRSSDNNVNILIDKLETQGYELNEKIKYYNNLINEQKNIVNEYQSKMNIISKKEEEILNLAKKKGEEYLLEVQVKADDLIKQIENAKSNITTPELADIKHQVNTLTKGNLNSELEEHDINVDDIVLIKAYNQEGLVLSINKNKYKVQMNNLTLDFKKEELKYVRKNEKKKEDKKKKYNVSITSNVKKEGKMQLDLRGVRYEDVYDMIDKFIDNAILSNISQVSIVHGYGTGAVRKAVQEYIRKSSVIKSSRYGKEGEGLMGVTVCTLK